MRSISCDVIVGFLKFHDDVTYAFLIRSSLRLQRNEKSDFCVRFEENRQAIIYRFFAIVDTVVVFHGYLIICHYVS